MGEHTQQRYKLANASLSCRARLDNCILGKNTKIGRMAELVRCVTQAGYEVVPEGIILSQGLGLKP